MKYINKILKEQFSELQLEIAQIEYPFKRQLNLPPYVQLSPKGLMQHLAEGIRAIKGYRIPKGPRIEDLDNLFFEEFVPLFRFK